MTVHIVGGVYHEYCVHPRWNEIYGSAGRAAEAISILGTPVILHSYMNDEALQVIKDRSVWKNSFEVNPTLILDSVYFNYLHDMAIPEIRGIPERPYPSITISEDKVVRFGMLEGDAVVEAEWAVYDPQNGRKGQLFGANGSTAEHLALVMNSHEAGYLAGMPGAHPTVTAPALAELENAEVVVVKMGPEGAYVWTSEGAAQIPAFRTNHVWKIGSGDCFVAYFSNAWMHVGINPAKAAEIASRATAYYCETKGFSTSDVLEELRFSPIQLSDAYRKGTQRQVYLAGPFFDLAQVWMVQEARRNLQEMGLRVFSPYHDIGLGAAEDVVMKDLEGIRESDLVLAVTDGLDAGTIYEIGFARALGKPVIVYSERHNGESLKMMEGSGCAICTDYTTALYSTLWEAVQI